MSNDQGPKGSVLYTWLVIWLFVLVILLQGQFAFKVVGDRGQPSWDYQAIEDVPGQSIYAIYPLLPNPQHVKGRNGE